MKQEEKKEIKLPTWLHLVLQAVNTILTYLLTSNNNL